MQYRFSVFNYNVDQKILNHDHQMVEIPKKCHELLLYLLENPNKLISRDLLIDHVWHGRVVTHNTIDQSILKLRKALNEQHPGDYIESVYGQGIRFIPEISTSKNNSISVRSNEYKVNKQNKLFPLTLLVLVIPLLSWLLYQQLNNKLDSTPIPSSNIDLSELSDSSTTNDNLWLIIGGRYYLQHLVTLNPHIKVNTNTLQERATSKTPLLAIEFKAEGEQKQTLLADITQSNNQSSPAYIAQLQIIQAEQIMREQVINANKLTVLFPKIAAWASNQTDSPVYQPNLEVYSQDEFALQSFLQARYQESNGNSSQALKFLESAVEQDPNFKMAWYYMSIALRKQSDPRKAIGILNALDTKEPNLAYRISLVKAQCLDAVREFQAAETEYTNALQLAKNLNQPNKIAAVHISQGILFRKAKQFDRAEEVLLSAAAVVDADSEPHLYGTIMSTHAKLAREMNQPMIAIEKARLAIKAFQQSGDRRYQMQAKTVLASILRLRNEFNQAEQLVKESLFHAEQLNNHRGISDNRTKLARIYQQTGRFTLALEQWQIVLNMNSELELYNNTAEAYLFLIQLHIEANNISQAEISLKLLNQLHKEQPSDLINQILAETRLMVALSQANEDLSEQYLATLITIEHPLVDFYRGELASLRTNYAAAEIHYLAALGSINKEARFDLTVLILNRLNEIYLAYNQHKLEDNLLQTTRYKPFIYPLQKYQALAAKNSNNHIKALSMMEELKLKAGDFWKFEDQLILDSMKSNIN